MVEKVTLEGVARRRPHVAPGVQGSRGGGDDEDGAYEQADDHGQESDNGEVGLAHPAEGRAATG